MGSLSVQQTNQEPFKMKLLILAVVLSAAWAAPSSQQLESVQPVAIVSSRSEINQDGSYSYAFESENGIKVRKADRRSRWATKPKKREPYPKEATPSPRPKVSYSPSTGWLTKTDSKPAATICPRPPPCPPTSSNF